LLFGLLEKDPAKRLGCGRGEVLPGGEEIKRHEFFEGVDWEGLLNREAQPPFVPRSGPVHTDSESDGLSGLGFEGGHDPFG
jgi:hypothetical protein